jgi:hypothetical protein
VTGFPIKFCDEMEARQLIRERVTSDAWWVLVPGDDVGLEVTKAVEERFYRGARSRDFEVMMLPLEAGAPGVVMARKVHCPADALAPLLRRITPNGQPIPGELLDRKNFILLWNNRAAVFINQFIDWMSRGA